MKRTLAIVALAGTLLANVKHAAAVYLMISPQNAGIPVFDWIYAVLVVLCLDLSVFVFTLHGKRGISAAFAVALCLVNIIYYTGDGEFTGAELVAILCYSGLFAFASYAYADLFHPSSTRSPILRKIMEETPEDVRDDVRVKTAEFLATRKSAEERAAKDANRVKYLKAKLRQKGGLSWAETEELTRLDKKELSLHMTADERGKNPTHWPAVVGGYNQDTREAYS